MHFPGNVIVLSKYIVKERKTIPFGLFDVDDVILQVVDENGRRHDQRRISLERGDTAAVLVHDEIRDEILLVRQFRYPALANPREGSDGWVLEIPAGIIERNEDADTAAKREVLEELGIMLSRVEHISTFFVSPGGTSERIVLFYASFRNAGESPTETVFKEERIKIERIPVTDFLQKVITNRIRDAKTLIAGYWLQGQIAARQQLECAYDQKTELRK